MLFDHDYYFYLRKQNKNMIQDQEKNKIYKKFLFLIT